MRRLAAGSERGLPETLTFVLDMKDDVSGSFWDILSLSLFSFLFFIIYAVSTLKFSGCMIGRDVEETQQGLKTKN